MRRLVPSFVVVAIAAGWPALVPSPVSAATSAQCAKFSAPAPVAVGGVLTRTARVAGCRPASATSGSGTAVMNLNTQVSTTTWAGGRGTTVVKITYKAGAKPNKCPSGTHLTFANGKVTGGSGTALATIKVGHTMSARWCVTARFAVTLEPGSVQKFTGSTTPTNNSPPPPPKWPLAAGLSECPANTAAAVTALANRDRRTHGNLPPLSNSPNLNWAARKHAITMAVKGYSFHDGWDTEIRDSRFVAGPPYWTGQNVGWMIAPFDPALIESGYFDEVPPNDHHRLAILNTNYHYIGIGCVIKNSNGAIFSTQDFGS